MTTTDEPVQIEQTALRDLREAMRGEVIESGHTLYDPLRAVWNADIDKYPSAIARCDGVGDVIACIQFARTNAVPMVIRGAGHNIAGSSTIDGGLLVDISALRGVRVDPKARRARAQGGCLLGDVDHATQAFGLATTLGVNSITGIGGLTLGGGIGWLLRKHGFSCDNVTALDVITADGELVFANKEENADLFWAMRGAGHNFGVATEFEYQLHPVDEVLAGIVLWPVAKAREILRYYREVTATAPDELKLIFVWLNGPGGPSMPAHLVDAPMVGIAAGYMGSPTEGEKVVASMREYSNPAVEFFAPRRYVNLQKESDGEWQPGFNRYWKSSYFPDLTDDAIDVIVDYGNQFVAPRVARQVATSVVTQPMLWFEISHMGGAAARIDENENALPHRQMPYFAAATTVWSDPADREGQVTWARAFWDALEPHSLGATYTNYLGRGDEDQVRATFGAEKYDRLASIKAKWDPSNFFSGTQNITPKR
jgi:FAD/FMN-containing dehydrogenase